MTKTINFKAFKAICGEIRAEMSALLAERNPFHPDEPMYSSPRDAMRFMLGERRKEWTIERRQAKTLDDYEIDLRIAARRAHTAAASPKQIKALAALAFAHGDATEGLLRSGALDFRQANAMIALLTEG